MYTQSGWSTLRFVGFVENCASFNVNITELREARVYWVSRGRTDQNLCWFCNELLPTFLLGTFTCSTSSFSNYFYAMNHINRIENKYFSPNWIYLNYLSKRRKWNKIYSARKLSVVIVICSVWHTHRLTAQI